MEGRKKPFFLLSLFFLLSVLFFEQSLHGNIRRIPFPHHHNHHQHHHHQRPLPREKTEEVTEEKEVVGVGGREKKGGGEEGKEEEKEEEEEVGECLMISPPYYYLHIPKAGSSFATTVVQGVCRIANAVTEPSVLPQSCRDKFLRFESGHSPLPSRDEKFEGVMGKEREGKRGKYVGLFRSPLGRMASGMVHRYHDCPFFLEQLSRMTLKEQVREYFRCVQGCSVRMLIGLPCINTPTNIPLGFEEEEAREQQLQNQLENNNQQQKNLPQKKKRRQLINSELAIQNATFSLVTPLQVKKAIDRLDSFAFIGITEKYQESVELWHKQIQNFTKIGISHLETINTRPTFCSSCVSDAKMELQKQGLIDWADQLLFNCAVQKFRQMQRNCKNISLPLVKSTHSRSREREIPTTLDHVRSRRREREEREKETKGGRSLIMEGHCVTSLAEIIREKDLSLAAVSQT